MSIEEMFLREGTGLVARARCFSPGTCYADLEDAAQETWLRALTYRSFQEADDPVAWLNVTLRSRVVSHHRRRQSHGECAMDAVVPPTITESGYAAVEAQEESAQWLAYLSSQQRKVVVLHYYFGYPLAAVADILGISEGAVKSHLARALRNLARVVGDAR